MNRYLVRLAGVTTGVLIGAGMARSAGLRTEVLFLETANLTYQLDAVAGVLPFTDGADFKALWQKEFLKSDADRAMLKQWGDLQDRYRISAMLPVAAMPLENFQSAISLQEGVRIAGLKSDTVAAYLDRLSLLVTPADHMQYAKVVRHFQTAFHRWWMAEGAKKGRAFADATRKELAREAIRNRIESFRRFYRAALPDDYVAPFSLIYRPGIVASSSSGQQLGAISIVEFFGKERPRERMDVVLHELCHFLYGSRTESDALVFQNRFVNTNDVAAKPAFNLLNEALATALGNGVIGRDMSTPEAWAKFVAKPLSFYNNSNIDRAGKRIFKLMDRWLPLGKTIDDPDFVPTYLSELKQEFGSDLTRPSLFLAEAFIFVEEKFGVPYARNIRNQLKVVSAYTSVSDRPDARSFEAFDEQPHLSAIVLITPSKLDDLVARKVLNGEAAAHIRAALSARKSALFSMRRSSLAFTFVVVAEDIGAAEARLKELKESPNLFEGLYVPDLSGLFHLNKTIAGFGSSYRT